MKVLTSWKIIQLFAEDGLVAGKGHACTELCIADDMNNIVYTWHGAKLTNIILKGFLIHL